MGPGRALALGLLLGVLGGAASGPHSLRFFQVGVTKPSPGVPEFVIVAYMDGNLIKHYDSDTRRVVPKVDWLAANLDQGYWDTQTQMAQECYEGDRVDLDILRQDSNQSGGVHTTQRMFGCDLLEDNTTMGYRQDAYDGKDFIAFDMDSMKFIAADAGAVVLKRRWEKDGLVAEDWKNFLENTCMGWLKDYVRYGQDVLERKEVPTVHVSAKENEEFLTLRCRVYGFYPRTIVVNWLKNGEVRDQDTTWSSIAPNSDGTYYTAATIDVRPEEKDKYRCRVEHASMAEPGLFALEPPSTLLTIVVATAAAVLGVSAVIAGLAFWKIKSGKKKDGYGVAPSTEGGSSSSGTGSTA